MVKVMKKKILISLIAMIMVALVVGNICSLATDGTSGSGTLTLTETGNSIKNTANTASDNTTGNTAADVSAEVGATNTNSANTTSNNTVKNTNSSRYNNTNAVSSGLPYAGSNTSIIFIVIALVVSAVYAYKKVSDYNV